MATLAMLLSYGILPAGETVDPKTDLTLLLEGVTKIGAPGSPGFVSVFGPQAFAVVAGGKKDERGAVVAAARFEKGRLVAFAHNGYFGAEALKSAGTGRLMANCARWAAGDKKEPRVATWQQEDLRKYLQAQGLNAKALSKPEAAAAEADVVILGMNGLKPEQEKTIAAFVAHGGGVITSDCPWGWLQLSGGKSLKTDMVANRLLLPAGLAFADGIADRTADVGYAAAEAPDKLLNASIALDLLEVQSRGQAKPTKTELQQAGASVTAAARAIPNTDALLLPRMKKLAAELGTQSVPTPKKPLKTTDGLARVLLAMQLEDLEKLTPEETKAHPAAAFFPGTIPDGTSRVTKELNIDGGTPGWHSTGLYAAPGEIVHVTLQGASPVKGLAVRVGAHQDGLWHHDAWNRVPEITRQWPIKDAQTRIASAFGGLIYIVVPGGDKIAAFKVQVRNAVEAPLFVLGQTDEKEWRERIRALSGPWAEFATKKVVLTVPSEHIRKLDDPVALMTFWDLVLDADAVLSGRSKERERPERIVSDVQISAGYMHSGYPIMTHLDAAPRMVDLAVMKQGEWGLFHELGHNHQSGDWTFGGTGEVTVNLFTLYVYEKVCGKTPRNARDNMAVEKRNQTLKKYLAARDFAKWQNDPFLALTMYVQLQEAFGWETYVKLFAEYRDLPKGERPKNDDEKRDQWMLRFSKAVGKNLGPFFETWGVPTSETARKEVANLPKWMPADWPQ
jgi:hypothetical protein